MNSQLQNFSDLKKILTTDKRFAAGAAFIFFALMIWLTTTTWREPPPPHPERYKTVKVEEQKELNALIQDFNTVLGHAKEERSYLRDSINRFKNDVDTGEEQFDWKLNSLVKKLEDITDNVDSITHKVGAKKVSNTKLDQKLSLHKKKKRRGNIQVKASDVN